MLSTPHVLPSLTLATALQNTFYCHLFVYQPFTEEDAVREEVNGTEVTLLISGKASTWTQVNPSVFWTTTTLCITRNIYFYMQMPRSLCSPSSILVQRFLEITHSNNKKLNTLQSWDSASPGKCQVLQIIQPSLWDTRGKVSSPCFINKLPNA